MPPSSYFPPLRATWPRSARLLRGSPDTTLPAFSAAWTHSTVSALTCRGESSVESSVEPSVDRRTARSSLRVLRQSFSGPPGPGIFQPSICANIARLYNRPLFSRTVVPAKKSRRLWMIVSMLLRFVFLRALAYKRLVLSARRWAPRTRPRLRGAPVGARHSESR